MRTVKVKCLQLPAGEGGPEWLQCHRCGGCWPLEDMCFSKRTSCWGLSLPWDTQAKFARQYNKRKKLENQVFIRNLRVGSRFGQ